MVRKTKTPNESSKTQQTSNRKQLIDEDQNRRVLPQRSAKLKPKEIIQDVELSEEDDLESSVELKPTKKQPKKVEAGKRKPSNQPKGKIPKRKLSDSSFEADKNSESKSNDSISESATSESDVDEDNYEEEVIPQKKKSKQTSSKVDVKDETKEKKRNSKSDASAKKIWKKGSVLENYSELIEYLEKSCPSNYKQSIDSKGKPYNNVVRLGAKIGDLVVITRPGIYEGLGVEILDDLKPLITDTRMLTALRILNDDNEDLPAAIKQLQIEREVQKQGVNVFYYAVREWLKQIKAPECLPLKQMDFSEFEENEDLEDMMKRVKMAKHTPLTSRIRVVQIGQSKKNNSVVPEEWIGREFENCEEMHREMDKLDWRRGKPPITYCCTYGAMNHVEKRVWQALSEFKKMKNSVRVDVLIKIWRQQINKELKSEDKVTEIKSQCWSISNSEELEKLLNEMEDKNAQIIQGDFKGNKVLIVVSKKDDFFKQTAEYLKKEENAGVLVSRVQKAIRRGRKAPNVLMESLYSLSCLPPYNLPDQQFVRVNTNRQLLWRLFISCVEDSRLYFSSTDQPQILSLQVIVILSLICQFDTDIQLNQTTLDQTVLTALHIQKEDNEYYQWRKGDIHRNIDLNISKTTGSARVDEVINSFKLALKFSPMMAGDAKMLRMHLSYIYETLNYNSRVQSNQKENNSEQLLKQIHLKEFEKYQHKVSKFLKNSDPKVEEKVLITAIDMHCSPVIILLLQSALPFYPCVEFSTKKTSSFIWEASSKFNVRNPDSSPDLSKKEKLALKTLREIQRSYCLEGDIKPEERKIESFIEKNPKLDFLQGKEGDKLVGRTAFLSLFGRRQRVTYGNNSNKTVEIIICGDEMRACKAKKLAAGNQMKYLEDAERFEAEIAFFKQLSIKPIEISLPDPPVGFEWTFSQSQRKEKVQISGKITSSDQEHFTNTYQFRVNGQILTTGAFDARALLRALPYPKEIECDQHWQALVRQVLYFPQQEDEDGFKYLFDPYEILTVLRRINEIRREYHDYRVFRIRKIIEESEILQNSVIWKHLLVKLFSDEQEIIIGPVDRSGSKLQHSISYVYEGALFRFFCLLGALYPRVLTPGQGHSMKIKLNRKYPEYLHMLDLIQDFTVSRKNVTEIERDEEVQDESKEMEEEEEKKADLLKEKKQSKESVILTTKRKRKEFKQILEESSEDDDGKEESESEEKMEIEEVEDEEDDDQNEVEEKEIEVEKEIKKKDTTQRNNNTSLIQTKLWEHQEATVERISDGFLHWGKKGFGDASCVGAGKTLTAIAVMDKLFMARNNNNNSGYSGFLVLIPSKQLFDTWITEIRKHSRGFRIIIQNANGSLSPNVSSFSPSDILITTLARIRDHPLYSSWQLVVIDECLSVQRREALQTEEAWRQVLISQYGVLMMSATFFRSRFDQLFFMLKILRSGIPETKEYLDSILNESMVCFIGDNGRKWTTNIVRFKLSDELRSGYEALKRSGDASSSEKLYNILADFLFKNYSIVRDLKNHIKKLEKEGCQVLIFARSKQEATAFSEGIPNVTRFPDLSGTHVAISYAEGTYGLNTLVKYNTLLTRPPEPDKLPQMKGRLDRPGQKSMDLRMEFMLVEDTIEEAWLLRLEIAKKFMSDYIMPLAQFYQAAVGY